MTLDGRTDQDLLAERRSLVLEQHHETDEIARGILAFYVAEIDRELARRRLASHAPGCAACERRTP